jgi:hypothetical protein
MSATPEYVANEVLTTKVGIMTHLAPRSSLTGEAEIANLKSAAHATPIVKDILYLTGFSEYVGLMDSDASEYLRSANRPKRLGDILVAKGLLTEERIGEAIDLQKKTSRRMGQIIIDKGWVSELDHHRQGLGLRAGCPRRPERTAFGTLRPAACRHL